jgi:hypothetical protein
MKCRLISFLLGTLAVSTSYANNVALSSLGATATTNAYLTYKGVSYVPSNVIDVNPTTEWVSPGGTIGPYLLINLGQLYSVNSIQVDGVGNPGLTTSFNIYVGTSPDLATLEGSQPVLSVLDQADGVAWSLGTNMVATSIQYVLYLATASTQGCPSACYPGNAYFDNNAVPLAGQDDAFTTGIIVNAIPEPITFGPFAIALLSLVCLRAIPKD